MTQGDGKAAGAGVAFWVVWALLGIATVAVCSWVWQQQSNTLHANGRWSSAKVGRSHGILGAVSFLTTRTALHRARLDLGTWHGYHELWTKEAQPAERVSLRFRLDDHGSLTVLLDRADGTADGLRFTGNDNEQSECLTVAASGRFLSKRDLGLPAALESGWHQLEWNRHGEQRSVRLDGRALAPCGERLGGSRRLGLRSTGSKRILVDDIEAQGADGRRFAETFRNGRDEGSSWMVLILLLVILDGLALVVTASLRRAGEVGAPAILLGVHGLLLILAGVVFLAEWIYVGRLHPSEPEFADYANEIEYEGEIVPRLAEEFPLVPPAPGERRAVLLGSSQTWGSGAARPEYTWAARLATKWAKAGPVEVINTGIPAFKSHQVRELWEGSWVRWAPELVLINLANNDREAESFLAELTRMVRFNRERGIRTVLVQEPNSEEARSEKSLSGLRERHAAMVRASEAEGVPVLDLHQALLAHQKEGFLWWDRVHLTDFGHEVMADEIDRFRATLLPGLAPR